MRLIGAVRSAGSKIAPWVTTKGHFKYYLQHSRDSRFPVDPAFKYDTYTRFFTKAYKGKLEVYPLIGFTGVACLFGVYAIYWSLAKPEIWLNRAHHDPPWDWGRCRTNYWTHNYARMMFYDPAHYHARKPLMETLNDELLEAAIKKGEWSAMHFWLWQLCMFIRQRYLKISRWERLSGVKKAKGREEDESQGDEDPTPNAANAVAQVSRAFGFLKQYESGSQETPLPGPYFEQF